MKWTPVPCIAVSETQTSSSPPTASKHSHSSSWNQVHTWIGANHLMDHALQRIIEYACLLYHTSYVMSHMSYIEHQTSHNTLSPLYCMSFYRGGIGGDLSLQVLQALVPQACGHLRHTPPLATGDRHTYMHTYIVWRKWTQSSLSSS